MLKIHAPTMQRLQYMARNISTQDIVEFQEMGKWPRHISVDYVYRTMKQWVSLSYEVYVAEINGKPAVLFGIATHDHMGEQGVPWMVTAEGTSLATKEYIVYAKGLLKRWRKMHPLLINWIPRSSKKRLRWLKLLGFKFEECPAVEIQPFYMESEDV